jgi:hypothetical protein
MILGAFVSYAQPKKIFCFQHRLCNLVQEFNGLVSDEGRILPALSIFQVSSLHPQTTPSSAAIIMFE